MKNFEARRPAEYPTEGSAALNPRYEENSARRGVIIAFPGSCGNAEQGDLLCSTCPPHPQHAKPSGSDSRQRIAMSALASGMRHAIGVLMGTDFLSNIRYGSAQGVPFNRMKRWQAVAAGCVFSAVAFATLLTSL